MRRLSILVLASLPFALSAAPANARAAPGDFRGHHQQVLTVVAVQGLTLADLPELAPQGAIGLLVPTAGPTTSRALAFAGIVRGVLHNERLGRRPSGPVLIKVENSRAIPLTTGVIVIGLPPGQLTRNDRRYPIAVFGACRGTLDSSLTRVPGLVSAADVARTALQSPHALTCRPDANAVATLSRLEQRVEVARSTTMAGTVIMLALVIAFGLILPAAVVPALGTALAVNLALGWVPAGSGSARLTFFASCIAAGGLLWRRLSAQPLVIGLGLGALLVGYGVAMAVHPSALSLAPIGPELTSRFFGVSNLLETLLLVPALLSAAALGRRFGVLGFGAIAAISLLVVAENLLGSDGGGAVVLGVAFASLAVVMGGARSRAIVPALAVAAIVVYGLVNVDLAISEPDHLRGALTGGLAGLWSVAAHRVPLSYARVLQQWYLVVPLAAIVALVLRSRRWPATRDRRALVAAFSAAIVTSLIVNDSPGPVALGGLAAFFAFEPLALRRELELLAARYAPAAAAVVTVETGP